MNGESTESLDICVGSLIKKSVESCQKLGHRYLMIKRSQTRESKTTIWNSNEILRTCLKVAFYVGLSVIFSAEVFWNGIT